MLLKKIVPCCFALVFGAASLHAGQPQPQQTFKADVAMGLPGATIQPGDYTIRVVDHLSDRYILRVDGGSGPSLPTFLGIPKASSHAAPGAIKWSKSPDANVYLKGWNFGGVTGTLEFVYPKNDAVAIAKANNIHVTAIDPASEGRVSNNGLSKEDMRMVTLWLLTPTQVGPGDASGGIKAERYQQVASVAHKPVIASLPHTASYLPLVALLGTLSVVGAAGTRLLARDNS